MQTTTREPLSPIRSIDDLLGMVPHLLGFHPSESLVLLLLLGNRLELTARCDLEALTDRGEAERFLQPILARYPEGRCWLVSYSPDRLRGWQTLDRLAAQLGDRCQGSTHVDNHLWWHSPTEPGGPYSPSTSAAAAEATVHGLVARPSRDDLAAVVQPDDPGPADHDVLLATSLDELGSCPESRWPRLMAAALGRALADPDGPDDADCVRLAVLARHPDSRDVASAATSVETAPELVRVWARVSRRVSDDLRAHPLALAGLAAWVDGDGALRNICVERAFALVPKLPLAQLLDVACANLIPPSAWEELRQGFLRRPSVRRVRRRESRRRR